MTLHRFYMRFSTLHGLAGYGMSVNLLCHGPGVFVLCNCVRLVFPVPVSGVSVEGEDALVVAAVVAAGVGDGGESCVAEGAGDQVAESGVGIGLVPGGDLLGVFMGGDVADIGSRIRPR
jgi:hypothetical protein